MNWQSLSLPQPAACQTQLPKNLNARLASGNPALDLFLGGGLPWGKLIEWGCPPGREGWPLLLRFVAAASQTGPCLWVGSGETKTPFPPAWAAKGVALEQMHFLQSRCPLKEAKEVFPHPLLPLILLDSPLGLRTEDMAYLAAQARAAQKLILVVRPYFLSSKQGNVWAALRLNSWQRLQGQEVLRGVKGVAGEVRLPPEATP